VRSAQAPHEPKYSNNRSLPAADTQGLYEAVGLASIDFSTPWHPSHGPNGVGEPSAMRSPTSILLHIAAGAEGGAKQVIDG